MTSLSTVDRQRCIYWGAAWERTQNEIDGYACKSSFNAKFVPQWMRSRGCMESEINNLRDELGKWFDDLGSH